MKVKNQLIEKQQRDTERAKKFLMTHSCNLPKECTCESLRRFYGHFPEEVQA